jgi:3-oxoacyl-(acyl-carrier-protein) synthase
LLHGLPNIPAHLISLEMQATGPLETITTACASGTQAIGAATELIRSGRVDRVFTGGVDCLILKEVIGAFDAMTVLSKHYNDTPERASRPFDTERDGFVMGEGAGILVLETLDVAQQRRARIYAEVLGHAASSDAYHSAAPDADGAGAIKAMRWALEDARCNVDDVDYINTHGTGTRVNDITETKAIKTLFGEQAYNMLINSTKSMIGHCMGGAGALEAIASALSIYHGVVHPTANLENPDPECDLDYVPHEARQASIRTALSNSFGLGGQNACLLLGKI